MKIYLILLLVATVHFTCAQESTVNPYLLGCENVKNKTAKEFCNSKSFSELYVEEFSKVLEKYGDAVPEGKAIIEFTIFKDGNSGLIKSVESDNPDFSQISLAILNDILNNFKKYGLKFKPITDENGVAIDKRLRFTNENNATQ